MQKHIIQNDISLARHAIQTNQIIGILEMNESNCMECKSHV